MINNLKEEYFEWLFNFVCEKRFSRKTSFRKLLEKLHSEEFTYIMDLDENRAADGTYLRYRFAISNDYDDDDVLERLDGPCSILEMMIALALRCEENIMDDPIYGNRTAHWFWNMVCSLGLGGMLDDNYDQDYVDTVIHRFLNREYEPNGKGGLFTIKNCDKDLRDVEIWCQLNWYLNNIL